MRKYTHYWGMLDMAFIAVLPLVFVLGVGNSAHAGEEKWTIRFEPTYMQVYGHDQHVLNIHEIDIDSDRNYKTALTLETEPSLSGTGGFQYAMGKWAFGIDFFMLSTLQDLDKTSAADDSSGTNDEVIYEVAGREYKSSDPNEVLYFHILPDTALQVWTADIYGMRTLAEGSNSGIHLQMGLRNADFDNDYRAVVGKENVAGTRLDAHSNYDRMMGPLVGLAADFRVGKSYFKGYIGQSLVFGDVELTSEFNGFTGSFSAPSYIAYEKFSRKLEVAIPITEFHLKWTYRLTKSLALGLGANTSVWRDVPVPPSVIPNEDGAESLHENTIVFFGLHAAVKLTF